MKALGLPAQRSPLFLPIAGIPFLASCSGTVSAAKTLDLARFDRERLFDIRCRFLPQEVRTAGLDLADQIVESAD